MPPVSSLSPIIDVQTFCETLYCLFMCCISVVNCVKLSFIFLAFSMFVSQKQKQVIEPLPNSSISVRKNIKL